MEHCADRTRPAVLRRRAGDTAFVPERRRSRRIPRRDPRPDVPAADLQEEATKPVETELIFRHSRFVGFDEDGGSPANIAASEAIETVG